MKNKEGYPQSITDSRTQDNAEEVFTEGVLPSSNWSNSHYNNYYRLTDEDIKNGSIKIDPYFVYKAIGLHMKDETGALFHTLKTLMRWGIKNNNKREWEAVTNQMIRYAELEGIENV